VNEQVTIPLSEIEHYHAFAGHFHDYLVQYIRKDMISFSVLREPLAGTRSHRNQVRRAPWYPHYERVRLQSFTEFVQDDRNRVMIENYQAR
jgi:hypothetical protein